MVKKAILLLVILSFSSLLLIAQPGMFNRDKDLPYTNPKPVYLEAHLSRQDSGIVCFVSYRISLNNLVFIRNDGDYTGGITLNAEAVKENDDVVRGSVTDEIHIDNYSDTESNDKFLQGVLSLEVDDYISEVNPVVAITNTDREFPLPPVRLKPQIEEFTKPFVVSKVSSACAGKGNYKIVNYENYIPLGDLSSCLLVPVLDSNLARVEIEIKQNDEVKRKDNLSQSISCSVQLEKCEGEIVLNDKGEDEEQKFFILTEAAKGLAEGHLQLSVFSSDSLLYTKDLEVVWPQKPRSLFDPEYAYKLLTVISSEDTLKAILRRNNRDYYLALQAYWNKRNPEKNNPYNALEAEFYNRVDYALQEFAVQDHDNSKLTDRGEIYVRYGKPSKVNRVYTEKEETTEVWNYDELNLQFVFVDKSGFGNFRLQ